MLLAYNCCINAFAMLIMRLIVWFIQQFNMQHFPHVLSESFYITLSNENAVLKCSLTSKLDLSVVVE